MSSSQKLYCGAVSWCPWAVAFFVLLNLAPRSLGTPANTSDYLLDFWTSDSGLPDSSVTAITQTPDGYLWLGTYNGLSRFDGVRFVDFDPLNTPELANARVDDLFVDAQGTLWINTHDGSMTACRHGVFTREWQGGQVSAVYLSAGRIYFALLRRTGRPPAGKPSSSRGKPPGISFARMQPAGSGTPRATAYWCGSMAPTPSRSPARIFCRGNGSIA